MQAMFFNSLIASCEAALACLQMLNWWETKVGNTILVSLYKVIILIQKYAAHLLEQIAGPINC